MIFILLIASVSGLVLNQVALVHRQRCGSLLSKAGKVPKLGGVVLVISFCLGFLGVGFWPTFYSKEGVFLAMLGLTFFLGFVDDVIAMRPFEKLLFQILIAAFAVSLGFHTQVIYLSNMVNQLLTVLWLVVLMNAFNFLDIVDGLAAGIAVITAGAFLALSLMTHHVTAGIFSAALLGANLAFYFFNRAPAIFYMGDKGSLFNGCAFAGLAIFIHYATPGREVALLAPLLLLALPLYDFLFVVFVRWKENKPLTMKSRDHFILRLLDRGVPFKKALALMYFFNFLFSLAALLLLKTSNPIGAALFVLTLGAWLLVAARVGSRKVF